MNTSVLQTGYELVRRAIEFDRPQRIPFNFDENRTDRSRMRYGDDFVWLFIEPDPAFEPSTPGKNEFGVVYETLDDSFGQAVCHPLLSVEQIEAYKMPDFSLAGRYETMNRRIRQNPSRYALAMFPHFLFLTAIDLLGFEPFLMELMTQRRAIERLLDRLTESCVAVVEQCARCGVHGLIAIEDLGLQYQLIVAPDLWRTIFKPRYKYIFESARKRGIHTFMHSCGNILEIIPDLIDIGLNVLQLDQQDNMGIHALSAAGQGKVCFFCPVDIQTILIKPNSHAEIERRVEELVTQLGTPAGGFIAKTYPQPDAIGIPSENVKIMCEAFTRYPYHT